MIELDGTNYLTCLETAKALDVHAGTLRNQRAHDRETVKSIKVGHSVLYRKTEVDAYLARCTVLNSTH